MLQDRYETMLSTVASWAKVIFLGELSETTCARKSLQSYDKVLAYAHEVRTGVRCFAKA
jgi:hypothetical protein